MTNGAELPCSEEVPELAAGAWTPVFIISGQVDQDDRITFLPQSLPFGGVDGIRAGEGNPCISWLGPCCKDRVFHGSWGLIWVLHPCPTS